MTRGWPGCGEGGGGGQEWGGIFTIVPDKKPVAKYSR